MMPVNSDKALLLNVYSNSFIFGTEYKGCLLLVLSHRAREAHGVTFAVSNGEMTHRKSAKLFGVTARERALYKTVSENGTHMKEIYLFIRKVAML